MEPKMEPKMDHRLGYFPVLDAALALRQAYESVRFSPFNTAMESLHGRLGTDEQGMIEEVGQAADGWLSVLGILLAPGAAGLKGAEEGLMQLTHAPTAALPFQGNPPFEGMGRRAAVPPPALEIQAATLLSRVLRTGILPEASRRSRALLEASEAIARGIGEKGPWPYLAGISDRIFRAPGGEIGFRIKPEFRMREQDVTQLVVTPSLVATRRLTFWRNGGTLVFFVSLGAPAAMDEAPDGLLLTALAVGDRTRLRMLRRLADCPCTNLEMAEFLGMNPSTASRHFKVFKDAGFVELREREGGRAEYELLPEGVEAGLKAIAAFIRGEGK